MIDLQEMLGKIQPHIMRWSGGGGLDLHTGLISTPPTGEQIISAFGVVDPGYRGLLQNLDQTTLYLCFFDGTSWWAQALTKSVLDNQFTDNFNRSNRVLENGWIGDSAAISSGSVIISPTLGSDKLTNGSMEAFTGGATR